MPRFVDIAFDCVPLRSIGRLDIPIDASPAYRALCERLKQALAKHGSYNSYYLHNARCVFHLTNREDLGTLEFEFQGTVLTDPEDRHAVHADLEVTLVRETCDWLTEPIVAWFHDTVTQAVLVEFDLYIAAGDLDRARQRIEQIQARVEQSGGFIGMDL
jgi:hypothetical protein